jgi:hypothetical protein
MRKTILWMLAALFAAVAVQASAQAPNERFESFLNGVAKDSDAAVDKLFRGSREEKISPKVSEQLKARLKGTIPMLGHYSGFEKIAEKDLSPSLRRVVYLQKFESVPALWVVYLYKAGPNEWLINTMNFTINLTDPIGAVLNGL